MAVQFTLFNFANYSPSIAMELKLSKEISRKIKINDKVRDPRQTNMLQAAEINFESC